MFIPRSLFFTRGKGVHKEELQSYELALRSAGIQFLNLVKVSSIFPPGCRILSRERGLEQLEPGQIVYYVEARASSNEPRRQLAASIGLALPSDKMSYGYLSEHHCFGMSGEESGDYAEDLAAAMLASTLGVAFDEDSSWDEKRQLWKISGRIVKSRNVTQAAKVDKNGRFTTVMAAAVFLP